MGLGSIRSQEQAQPIQILYSSLKYVHLGDWTYGTLHCIAWEVVKGEATKQGTSISNQPPSMNIHPDKRKENSINTLLSTSNFDFQLAVCTKSNLYNNLIGLSSLVNRYIYSAKVKLKIAHINEKRKEPSQGWITIYHLSTNLSSYLHTGAWCCTWAPNCSLIDCFTNQLLWRATFSQLPWKLFAWVTLQRQVLFNTISVK